MCCFNIETRGLKMRWHEPITPKAPLLLLRFVFRQVVSERKKRKKGKKILSVWAMTPTFMLSSSTTFICLSFFGLLPPLTFENKIKQSCSTHKTHTTAPCWSKTDGWIRPKQNHPSLIPTRQPYGQLSIKSMNKKRSSDVHYNEQNEH